SVDRPCAVNEEDLVNSAGCGIFPHRAGIRLRCLTKERSAIELVTMQQQTTNQTPSKANAHPPQRPKRLSKRFMQALGVAMLVCLTPASEGSSAVEVPLEPIVVISEPLNPP